VSSDLLSQDTSSSVVTLDYDDDANCPTHLTVLVGGSPDSREPTFTNQASHQRISTTSQSGRLPLDEGQGDRQESEKGEDCEKTTSAVEQSTAATNSDCPVANQTSASPIINFTLAHTDIEHLGQAAKPQEPTGSSLVASKQAKAPSGEPQEDEAFNGKCEVKSFDVARPGSAAVQRKPSTSVAFSRRRRGDSKTTDIPRVGHCDQLKNKKKGELSACRVASTALLNGIKPSPDDEERTSEINATLKAE